MMGAAEQFEQHRGRLFGLAYRMLGSVADAEDTVQDAFLRWRDADHRAIDSPEAWLVRVCSRLAIDRLRSLKSQRQEYVGTWLPEPVVSESRGPLDQLEIDETVSIALLMVLEALSPGERAAFILHDVFDRPFEEIATILDKSPAACRKLASRARQTVRGAPSQGSSQGQAQARRETVERFLEAIRSGDVERIQALLTDDVTLCGDGGGRVPAVQGVLVGPEAVATFLARVVSPQVGADADGARFVLQWFNGAPGLVRFVDDKPETVYGLAIDDGAIRGIYAIRNPDKLAAFHVRHLF